MGSNPTLSAIMRFIKFGLYNSGSSALAGMFHLLGANLGRPFWHERPGHASTVFEAAGLARELRHWWSEPVLRATSSPPARIAWLADWVVRQEQTGAPATGAKHPLLALSAGDVRMAWGATTRFLWTWRPFPESVAGLRRRGWFPGREPGMQQCLWEAINRFVASGVAVTVFDWKDTRSDPVSTAGRLAAEPGIRADTRRLAVAASVVRRPALPG